MANWKPCPEEEKLLRALERYTGRKFPPVTEEQMNAAMNSLLEWDKAGRPLDEKDLDSVDVGLFR